MVGGRESWGTKMTAPVFEPHEPFWRRALPYAALALVLVLVVNAW